MVTIAQSQGHVLRMARREARLNLREVAASSHVTLGYISEIERGLKIAHPDIVASIADSVGINMPTLLRRTADLLEGKPSLAPKRRTG